MFTEYKKKLCHNKISFIDFIFFEIVFVADFVQFVTECLKYCGKEE